MNKNTLVTGILALLVSLSATSTANAEAISKASVDQWLDAYGKAWETRDADSAAALFSENATYQENPYEEPFSGRTGVRDYWSRVTADQRDVSFTSDVITTFGRSAVAHWSARFASVCSCCARATRPTLSGTAGEEARQGQGPGHPVLLFELLEPLGFLSLHAAVLVAPALERRLADPQGLADLADRPAGRQHAIRVAQLLDDLSGAMSRPLHRESSWPSWPSDSHSTWTTTARMPAKQHPRQTQRCQQRRAAH